jgi:hypothetical protein
MKTLQRRMSAGWSFTAGVFFGAVAVFVLLSSLHIPRLKAETSHTRTPVVESAVSAFSPQTPAFIAADVQPADRVVRPPSDALRKARPRSSIPRPRFSSHSELDLQLD